jgi:hypothetical protein
MAMADQATPPFLVDLVGVHRKEGCHFGLDRGSQHLPRPLTQHGEQRVVLDRPSWPRQPNNGILLHGVSFSSVTSSITEDTPPPTSSPKFDHSPCS